MALKDFKELGDNLTIDEFNGLISLYRNFKKHYDFITIDELVNGAYADYVFDIEDLTVLDKGIFINEDILENGLKIKLENPVFKFSTYKLKLTIWKNNGVNVFDDDTIIDFKETHIIEADLITSEFVTISLRGIEYGSIISFNAEVEIHHDKTEIHYINDLSVNAEHNPVMVDEVTDIKAGLIDYNGEPYNLIDGRGKKVYFYEVLTPTFTLSANPSIIQSGGTTDIECKVKDADGSIAINKKIYFYKKEEI